MHPVHQVSQAKLCTETFLSWHLAHACDGQNPTWAATGAAKQAEKGKARGNIPWTCFFRSSYMYFGKKKQSLSKHQKLPPAQLYEQSDRSVQQHYWGSEVDLLLAGVSSVRAFTPQYHQQLVSGFKALFCTALCPSLRTKKLECSFFFLSPAPSSYQHLSVMENTPKFDFSVIFPIYFVYFWNTRNQFML